MSCDRNEEEWEMEFASMPWISLPYSDMRNETLRKSFQIDVSCKGLAVHNNVDSLFIYTSLMAAIPTLILLDEKSSIITTEGWTYMLNDPDGAVCRSYNYTIIAISLHVNIIM